MSLSRPQFSCHFFLKGPQSKVNCPLLYRVIVDRGTVKSEISKKKLSNCWTVELSNRQFHHLIHQSGTNTVKQATSSDPRLLPKYDFRLPTSVSRLYLSVAN